MKKNSLLHFALLHFALLLPTLLSGAEAPLFTQGKVHGKLSIATLADFEQQKVIKPDLAGWGLQITPEKIDWSDCRALVFDLYSIRPEKEQFAITINSPQTGKRGNYSLFKLPVKWKGWKTIVIPFRQFRPSGSPDWKHVVSLHFTPKGFGLTPQKGGVVYLRNIRLLAQKKENPADRLAVNLIPVNSAESILSPFWDAGLSDFKRWEIQCADGSAVQKWDVHLHWKGKIRMIRKMDLDVTRFDTIIPALSLLPGVKVKVEAESDKGKRSAEYTVPDDQGKTTEFPLALNGATRLTEFSVTLDSPKKTFGFFKYLLISDSKRLKDVERQYADLGKMDFSKYIYPEDEIVPTFQPGLNLYCAPEKLESIRQAILGDTVIREKMRKRIQQIRSLEQPEKSIRAYATRDRRFTRDRDFIRDDLFNLASPAWLGTLLRDPELTRLAARRAIALVLTPDWGAGMMSTLPGTTFEHRCFTECDAMENLAFVLDFCHELFTPYGRDLILRTLAERGAGTANFNAWRWNYIYNCNQLSSFSMGRIAAYAAMEKSGWTHVRPYTDLAIAELNQSMNRILESDGGYLEGPSYYQYTFWGALPAYYLYARLRGREFRDVLPSGLKNAPDYVELFFSTDDSQGFLPVNDGNSGIYPQNSLIFAEIFPNSPFGRLCNKYKVLSGPVQADNRWSWLAGTPGTKKPEPSLRHFLKLDSIASASSVRELDGKTLKIAFLCDMRRSGHKHPDAGSFLIEYAGETYAMDSGIVSYSSPFSKELQQEERHNVMVPVKADGSYGKQIISSGQLKLNASGDAKRFSASVDLLPCWKGQFRKRLRHLRSDSPEKLTILDEYELTEGKGAAFFWLSPFPIRLEGRHVEIRGKRGRITFTVPEGWTPKIEELPHIKKPQYRLTLTSTEKKGKLELQVSIGGRQG